MTLRDTTWLVTGSTVNFGNAKIIAMNTSVNEVVVRSGKYNFKYLQSQAETTYKWYGVSGSAASGFIANRKFYADSNTYQVTIENEVLGAYSVTSTQKGLGFLQFDSVEEDT